MRRRVFVLIVVVLAGAVAVAPAQAAHSASLQYSTASDFQSGSLSNAEVVRSGEAGAVSHGQHASSAVARYAMDSGSGSTAYDYAANNDGSISGATWTSGIRGQALSFDGTESVDISGVESQFSSNDPITLTAWVKPDAVTASTDVVLEIGDGINSDGYVRIVEYQNQIYAQTGDGIDRFGVAGDYTAGEWTHVAAVFDGTHIKLYLDGEFVGETAASYQMGDVSSIGMQNNDADYFNGDIDEPRVYADALTAGELRRLTDTPATKQSPQATNRWAFDEGTGSTAFGDDGNDATLSDHTWTSGISGNAVSFSEGGRAATSTSLSPDAGDFSFSGWFKTTGSSQQAILSNYDGQSALVAIFIDSNGILKFQPRDGDRDGTFVTSDQSVADNEWHHFTATREGDTFSLFVDGVLVGQSQRSGIESVTSGTPMQFGNSPNGGQTFTGSLSEVRYYDGEALTQADAQYLNDHPGAQLAEQGQYTSSGRGVEGSTGGTVDLEMLNTEATVTWQGSTDGGSTWQTLSQATYTTSGVHSQSWSTFSGGDVRSRVEFNTTNSDHYARLLSESIEYETAAPVIDDATASPDSSTETASSLPVELSVNISDADFGTPQGDELTANWYIDGQQRTTTTITSSGEAGADVQNLDAGVHTWSVEVTDQQGHTVTSDTFEVAVPGELEVYNEAKPNQIVDNTTLRVRVFDGTSDTVVEREVTDGTVDFSGLPATGRFIVTVDGDDNKFNYRRIVVSSLVDQQEIYLLPTDVTSADITFRLDDATGAFPSEETRLFIERPINKDFDGDGTNETQYQVISGDNFGAAQDFPTTLETGERYRLRIENNDGDVRVLGSYTATGDAAETLEIGSVTISGEADDGAAATARIIGEGSDRSVRVIYDDAENRTESLQIAIHKQGNESATLIEPETIDGMNSFVGTYPLPPDAPPDVAYEVDVQADRGDATYATTKYVGELPELIGRFNIDPAIAGLIGWIAITSLGGLVVIYNARLGAVMMVITAGFTTVIGATQIPTAALALAGSVAVVFLVAGRDGSPV